MADDQCCYPLGCYGNPDVNTPDMDKLGADGVIFDNHCNTTWICMASRSGVMKGLRQVAWADRYKLLVKQGPGV